MIIRMKSIIIVWAYQVATGGKIYCIVSYIANPAVTLPPGEFIYIWIGLLLDSDCKNNNCATINELNGSWIGPIKHMIRSFSSLEYIS